MSKETFASEIGTDPRWDERYRLTSAVRDSVFDIQYSYDVLNRRISRIEGTTTNYFVYDGNQVVTDLDGNGDLLRTYVWGTGIDNLLSMTTYSTTATNTYYAIKDHQNSVIALVDATGSVVESYEYSAYGKTKEKGSPIIGSGQTPRSIISEGNRPKADSNSLPLPILNGLPIFLFVDADLSSDCLLQGAKELSLYCISPEHRTVAESSPKYGA